MLHASTQKLVIKLCELTEAGHIAWKHGEGRTCSFETEGYVVEVQGQPPRLRLLHADGRELERADEIDLASTAWPDGDGATFASQIGLLAARADRFARGAEFAIARILSSLSAPPKTAAFASAGAADPPPPPAPHTVPGPPPDPVASDTAIDRVLAVESDPLRTIEPAAPEPEPGPVIIESEATAVVGDPETVEELVEEATAEDAETPMNPAAPEPPAVGPEPVVIEAEAVAIVPQPELAHAPAPEPPASEGIGHPRQIFGAIASFAKPGNPSATTAVQRASSPKPFSTSPLFFGVNQMSREPGRVEPEPPPVPPPTAKPASPTPSIEEKKPVPAVAGPDIYKPWS